MKRTILAAVILAVCGCASAKPAQRADVPIAPFEPPTWSTEQGSASVAGQAFLRTMGGEVRTCAGNRVLLIPATPFARSALESRKAGGPLAPVEQMAPYIRSETCDAQGNFRFDGLPDGEWLVESGVFWYVRDSLQGAGLVGQVVTQGGQTRAILTDTSEIPFGCRGPKKHRCALARRVYGLFDVPAESASR